MPFLINIILFFTNYLATTVDRFLLRQGLFFIYIYVYSLPVSDLQKIRWFFTENLETKISQIFSRVS